MTEPDPLVGQVVAGRYRVVCRLGAGGMGVVYGAQHETLARRVALKVLTAGLIHETEAVARFEREAQAAGAVGHPAVADVFDLGRLADGRPFLAMPWFEGEDLGQRLQRLGPLPPAEVVALLSEAASGLDALHAHGLLHRDIKPSNLFLAESPAGTSVKILDLGLVLLPDEGSEGGGRLTRTGHFHGSPHYMAPEQAGAGSVGPATDVYGLASVAFELLTGDVPFDDPNPLALLTRKMRAKAPTLSEAAGWRFPARLEAAVAQGLARVATDRPQSAGALAEAMRAALEEGPAASASAPPAEPPAATAQAAAGAGSDGQSVSMSFEDDVDFRPGLPVWPAALVGILGVGLAVTLLWPEPEGAAPEPREAAVVTVAAQDAAARAGEADRGGAAADTRPADAGPADAGPADVGPTDVGPADAAPGKAKPDRAPPAARRRRPKRRRVAALTSRAPATRAPATAAPATAPPSPPPNPEDAPPPPDPAAARAKIQAGTQALIAGRLPQAATAFEAALTADRRAAAAWRGLGLVRERQGRRAAAARAYRRYLRAAPGAADAADVEGRITRLSSP